MTRPLDTELTTSGEKKMTFDEFLKEQLKDPEIKAEWDKLGPQYDIAERLITARMVKGISRAQLAEITGIKQSIIARIENATGNPSVETLRRIAEGLGKKLKIEFV